MRPLAVIGGSLAGLRAAQGARAQGWTDEIVIVGDEPHKPYTRPPLSKGLLTDASQGISDHLLPAELEATWLLGRTAVRLEPSERRVTLSSGEVIDYERLVIATGCRARRFGGPGADLSGLHTIRRIEDALALRESLAAARRVAIVGAGFIGCEVASSAAALGLEVLLIDAAPAPMPALGPVLGDRCAQLHRSRGVKLHLGVGVAAIHGGPDRRVREIELSDGSRHLTDVVVVAVGGAPSTDWLASSGLDVEAGVRCDATLTVEGAPDVLAAGDVALWPHALAGGELIRVEHWTNAVEQGTQAGRNAVLPPSERRDHTAIPSFWSDQHDTRIQSLGLPHIAHRHEIVEETSNRAGLVAVCERDGRLVGVVGFNAARRLPAYRARIGQTLDIAALQAAAATDPKALGVPARILEGAA